MSGTWLSSRSSGHGLIQREPPNRLRHVSRMSRSCLRHGQGVIGEEGRDGGLPFPFIQQRSDRATQLIDCQDVLSVTGSSAVDFEIVIERSQKSYARA